MWPNHTCEPWLISSLTQCTRKLLSSHVRPYKANAHTTEGIETLILPPSYHAILKKKKNDCHHAKTKGCTRSSLGPASSPGSIAHWPLRLQVSCMWTSVSFAPGVTCFSAYWWSVCFVDTSTKESISAIDSVLLHNHCSVYWSWRWATLQLLYNKFHVELEKQKKMRGLCYTFNLQTNVVHLFQHL